MAPFMKTRPLRFSVATGTFERLPLPTCEPRPGWRAG